MRWMYAKQKPEDNILFGYGTADEARRELLVLWNVYVFFVTYARLSGWQPATGAALTPPTGTTILDRWILSRTAAATAEVGADLADFDSRGAALRLGEHIDELSTWYLRRSRRRLSRNPDPADRDAAFATLHAVLVGTARMMAPVLPFLAEHFHQSLVSAVDAAAPDSVHLTGWPAPDFAPRRDESLERAMAIVMRAVDLGRTLRSQNGLNLRQPIRQAWIVLPPGINVDQDVLDILGEELNAKATLYMPTDLGFVERRVKPLLPKIGKRLGAAIPAVMAAARANEVEYLPDGSVRLGGVELAADEVEIISTAREGRAVAHDHGLVLAIDTEIDDALRAEGDARELSRAVQDLRKSVGLELDETIDLWLDGPAAVLAGLDPYIARVLEDTLVADLHREPAPGDATSAIQAVSSGEVTLAIRRRSAA